VEYELHYGHETLAVDIDHEVEVLLPHEVEAGDEDAIIKKGLSNPIGAGSFGEFAAFDKSLLVIVNDATRPTPTARIIGRLYPVLSKHPDVSFIIATGAHREPTREEYDFIFGDYYEEFEDRIHSHDSKKDEMVHLGTSKAGTEMFVNKMLKEADNVLVIGSVEPHYFAGYTGGRKSFLPGIASYETIEMNHKHALSNRSRTLALEGNAVHEDMIDALENLKELNIYSVQTVLTGDHRIFAVTAGELHQSFHAAVEEANKIFCVPLTKRGNIVVTVAPHPMDIDLYQSQKAIDNAKFALASDGIMILVSRCVSGVGGKTFFDLLSSQPTPQEVLYKINKEYKLGYHKAAKLAQIGVWAKMWAVTELPDDTLESINITPKSSVQGAIDEAVEHVKSMGKEPRIILMPNGCLTVPVLEGTDISSGFVRVKTDLDVQDMLGVLEVVLEG
jgi:nickel-dependent lactate racemase